MSASGDIFPSLGASPRLTFTVSKAQSSCGDEKVLGVRPLGLG